MVPKLDNLLKMVQSPNWVTILPNLASVDVSPQRELRTPTYLCTQDYNAHAFIAIVQCMLNLKTAEDLVEHGGPGQLVEYCLGL